VVGGPEVGIGPGEWFPGRMGCEIEFGLGRSSMSSGSSGLGSGMGCGREN
jgi:hypothetical protein